MKKLFVAVLVGNILAMGLAQDAEDIGCTGCNPAKCAELKGGEVVRCLECLEGYTLTRLADRISRVCIKDEEPSDPETEPDIGPDAEPDSEVDGGDAHDIPDEPGNPPAPDSETDNTAEAPAQDSDELDAGSEMGDALQPAVESGEDSMEFLSEGPGEEPEP